MAQLAPERLLAVLADARALGFLGPDEPRRHIDHAGAFIAAIERRTGAAGPAQFLDLGSGAGIPGLVLLAHWPATTAVFLDASQRRCAFAGEAAGRLGLADRVVVRCERAEVVGRDATMRERAAVVVARSFGAPAVTAEVASALVAVGGVIVVSEPPDPDPDRWPAAALAGLGLGAAVIERARGFGVAVIPKEAGVPDNVPRRVGIPNKRPLW